MDKLINNNKIKIGFVMLLTTISSAAFARSQDSTRCDRLDLRSVSVGSECITSAGVIFQLQSRDTPPGDIPREVWKDVASGLYWSDISSSTATQYRAIRMCEGYPNARVPEKRDFENADRDGIREVLPNLVNQYYWSSTVSPSDSTSAYVYRGNDGRFEEDPREYQHFARCIWQ